MSVREASPVVSFDTYFKGKFNTLRGHPVIFFPIKMEFNLLILYSWSSQSGNETATGPSGWKL